MVVCALRYAQLALAHNVKMRWLVFLVLLVACGTAALSAQDECAFGGDNAFNDLLTALHSASSCHAAVDQLHRCEWGSSADTQFAPVVISKCEKSFLSKLPRPAEERYIEEMQLCAYEESRADGTLAMSEAAMCQVDVAAQYDAHPENAHDQPLRASFDCSAANSPLQRATCSHTALGHAEIVLSRVYDGVLKSIPLADRPALIQDEKDWLAMVPQKCGLNLSSASDRSINCARNEFELRFTALDDCEPDGPDPQSILACILESSRSWTAAPVYTPLASFDCEKPSDGVEFVVCDDSDLGQLDLKLAAVYHDTYDLLPPTQHVPLASSQQRWHNFVARSCPLGVIGGIPAPIARGCIRDLYQKRVAQLQSCARKESSQAVPCLNHFLGLDPGVLGKTATASAN
ncbi:MAG TPA: hypothetical protein VGM11_14150 [Acidobacteriaceae bacterium]